MAIFKFFFKLRDWLREVDTCSTAAADPFSDAQILEMDARMLADLPFGEVAFMPDSDTATTTTPALLCRCA